jgi:hypothetical protein
MLALLPDTATTNAAECLFPIVGFVDGIAFPEAPRSIASRSHLPFTAPNPVAAEDFDDDEVEEEEAAPAHEEDDVEEFDEFDEEDFDDEFDDDFEEEFEDDYEIEIEDNFGEGGIPTPEVGPNANPESGADEA